MSALTWLRAAARLTPHMALHQTKRILRNRIVPKFPDRYARSIDIEATKLAGAIDAARVPIGLAQFIGSYYAIDDQTMDAAAEGIFTLLGRRVDFGDFDSIDWSYKLPDERDHHLWRMKLTQLEIVHSLLASSDPQRHQFSVRLLEAAGNAASFGDATAFKLFWAPYGASHRLLAICSGLALAQEAGSISPEVLHAVHEFMARDAAFLWRNIEFDLRNNHTERNLAALCLFHLASGAPSPARRRMLDRSITNLVRATVLPDGMQIERSAMYQGLTCMSLRIFASTTFLSDDTRSLARERGAAAEAAWLFLTHADGEIALFNDAWMDEIPPAREVLGDTALVAEGLPHGGYQALKSGTIQVWLDSGEIGPTWNPGHGHADFLAIELDVAGRRLIVDPGTSQYSTGEQRSWERAAASHNGPRLGDVEPVEYSGCFKVGRMAAAEALTSAALSNLPGDAIGGMLNVGSHRLARLVVALPKGGVLVADAWSAPSPPGSVDLLIPADWAPAPGAGHVLLTAGDTATCLSAVRGTLGTPIAARWTRYFMTPEPAWSLALTPESYGTGQRSAFVVGDPGATASPQLLAAVDLVFDRVFSAAGHDSALATSEQLWRGDS